MKSRISLHPYLAAGLEILAGLFLLLFLLRTKSLIGFGIWILVRSGITILMGLLVYCPPPLRRVQLISSLVLEQVAMALVVVIADTKITANLAGAVAILASATSYALLPPNSAELTFALKPLRRSRLMLMLITIFGFSAALSAGSILQLLSTSAFLSASAALLIFLILAAVWWWKEYSLPWNNKMFLASAVLFVVLLELMWFIWWWPVGYFTYALLIMWAWYLLWLILRFEQTGEGINWKKQTPFLIFNLITLALFLSFIVRFK